MHIITTSAFNSLPVIVFRNHSTKQIDAIICKSTNALHDELERMKKLEHIEILSAKHAAVAGRED